MKCDNISSMVENLTLVEAVMLFSDEGPGSAAICRFTARSVHKETQVSTSLQIGSQVASD